MAVAVFRNPRTGTEMRVSGANIGILTAWGWERLDDGAPATPPDPFPQYLSEAELATEIGDSASPVGVALRAAFVPIPAGGADGQALIKAGNGAAWGTVSGGGSTTRAPTTKALAVLRAGLAARATTPCRIVFAGSSTTAGQNASTAANRYVNRLVAALQAAYPSGLGSETAVVASTTASWGTVSSAAGVHGYNAGESGTTAANYLTSGEIASAAALNPRAVLHMIGTNDWSGGVAPATYKANVQNVIASLKAATSGPCVHILVASYGLAGSPTYPWSQYITAMREIADADPDHVAFIDLSEAYALVGVPGSDPLDLLDTDGTHQTNAGHAYMADLLRSALVNLPLGETSTTPTTPDTTAPSVPTSLSATPGDGQVALSWAASTDNVGVTGYRVRRGGSLIASPTGTSYTDTGRTNGTQYSYTVSAVDAAGNESAQTSAVTATPVAAGPVAITETFAGSGSIAGTTTDTGGKTWSVQSSGADTPVFTESGGVGGWTTVTNTAIAVVDAGSPDFTIEATLAALGSGPANQGGGLAIRFTNGLNGYWLSTRLTASQAGFVFYKYEAGGIGSVGSQATSPVPTVGQRLKVVASGTTLTGYVDGVQVCQVTGATFNQAGQLAGFFSNTSGLATRWDDLSITTP
ncbi:GDSL-type esterase/lipase family protein [Blastococcus sp. SYSU D00813]